MMRSPAIRDVRDVVKGAGELRTTRNGKEWVPARTTGLHTVFSRFKATWLVFTGKADALTWPGQ